MNMFERMRARFGGEEGPKPDELRQQISEMEENLQNLDASRGMSDGGHGGTTRATRGDEAAREALEQQIAAKKAELDALVPTERLRNYKVEGAEQEEDKAA
jgi:hypothetical protein